LLFLALLPLAVALATYYRPLALRGQLPPAAIDAGFYVYQLDRVSELNGRWWELGQDERMGHPYQTSAAKNPGLYEGVDLLLLSTVSARFLGPLANYHFCILAVLAVNGWVASWLVFRLTRSHAWAGVGAVLITANVLTASRLQGHLHLFKFGWVVLAVWAFSRYLEAPTLRRGLWLGLAAALVLQGSFYFGFLLALGLGAWWLGCAVAGTVGRRHLAPTAVALLACAVPAALLTFPVWTVARRALLADTYFARSRLETWWFGSELWEYFVSPLTSRVDEFQHLAIHPSGCWEGWNFPGYTVLAALGVYLIARLRGWHLHPRRQAFLDRAAGLIGVWVVLGLAGGPSAFLFDLIPSFRCYGRTGLLMVGVWSVLAPVALAGVAARLGRPWLGPLVLVAGASLAGYDAYQAQKLYFKYQGPPCARAGWPDWLRRQPADVHVAVFPSDKEHIGFDFSSLGYLTEHGHATLNGCEMSVLNADLGLVGASYWQMNEDGLRFIASLGYDTLAFHPDYLAAHRWIRSLDWLEPAGTAGEWEIYRVSSRADRWPTVTADELLAAQPRPAEPLVVPHGAWITGSLEVPQKSVLVTSGPVQLTWSDADGRRVGQPVPALMHHLVGPGLPAYAVKTPLKPGDYELAFLDGAGRQLASVPYRVRVNLDRSAAFGLSAPACNALTWEVSGEAGDKRVVLENHTCAYLQGMAERPPGLGRVGLMPGVGTSGLFAPWAGSLYLKVTATPADGGPSRSFLLPLCDLPPDGQREIEVPVGHLLNGRPGRITIAPDFSCPKPNEVSPENADVRLIDAERNQR
jgi:hypothetical protein